MAGFFSQLFGSDVGLGGLLGWAGGSGVQGYEEAEYQRQLASQYRGLTTYGINRAMNEASALSSQAIQQPGYTQASRRLQNVVANPYYGDIAYMGPGYGQLENYYMNMLGYQGPSSYQPWQPQPQQASRGTELFSQNRINLGIPWGTTPSSGGEVATNRGMSYQAQNMPMSQLAVSALRNKYSGSSSKPTTPTQTMASLPERPPSGISAKYPQGMSTKETDYLLPENPMVANYRNQLRQAQTGRGLYFGPASAQDEAKKVYQYSEQLRQQAAQQYAQLLGLRSGSYMQGQGLQQQAAGQLMGQLGAEARLEQSLFPMIAEREVRAGTGGVMGWSSGHPNPTPMLPMTGGVSAGAAGMGVDIQGFSSIFGGIMGRGMGGGGGGGNAGPGVGQSMTSMGGGGQSLAYNPYGFYGSGGGYGYNPYGYNPYASLWG